MLTDLAVAAFRQVEIASGRSVCGGDFIPTKDDIPRLTGLHKILGSEFKNLHYFFRVESASFLTQNRDALLDRIREVSGIASSSWKDTKPILNDIWRQFFGMGSVDPRWPGFVVVMPKGYVTTRHQSRLRDEKGGMPVPESIEWPKSADFNLRFSPFLKKYDIAINSDSLRLRTPPGRDSKWARPVTRVLTRKYRARDGSMLPEDYIFQVGRAAPDDEVNLWAGGYYPATEGLRIADSGGRSCFTRSLNVLVVARLVPGRSNYDPSVHQLTLTLSEDASEILDINCLRRDFGRFAEHYPGILNLMVDYIKP